MQSYIDNFSNTVPLGSTIFVYALIFFVISVATWLFLLLLPKPDNHFKARSTQYFRVFVLSMNLAFLGFVLRYFDLFILSAIINNLFLITAAFTLMFAIYMRYEIAVSPRLKFVATATALTLVGAQVVLIKVGVSSFYREFLLDAYLLIPAIMATIELKRQSSKNRIKEKAIFYSVIGLILFLLSGLVVVSEVWLEGDFAMLTLAFMSSLIMMIMAFVGFTLSIIYSLVGKLRKKVFTDKLTGANSRELFYEVMNKELARAKRHTTEAALIVCDIDHFKTINDSYGHLAGDETLKRFVRAVSEEIRIEDQLFRIGGEEFVIVCPDVNATAAKSLANRIREKVAALSIPTNNEKVITLTSSFGVADLNPELSVEANLNEADKRLYLSKQQGRNQVN